MLNAQITVNEAARETARAVSLGFDPAAVGNVAVSLGADPPQVISSCLGGNSNAEVRVTDEFTFVTPFAALAGIVGGPFDLTATGVMPCRG
jgi:hypothetical protein